MKLDDIVSAEAVRVQRYQSQFSAILLDIDHFKRVNDEYGHLVGDLVLQSLAKVLKTQTRSADVVGRWGGEEFMVLCLETSLKGASDLAEKTSQGDRRPRLQSGTTPVCQFWGDTAHAI